MGQLKPKYSYSISAKDVISTKKSVIQYKHVVHTLADPERRGHTRKGLLCKYERFGLIVNCRTSMLEM